MGLIYIDFKQQPKGVFMNLKLFATALVINFVVGAFASAQNIYAPVPVGGKLKFSLKIASSEDKKLKNHTLLAIADGVLQSGYEYNPKAGEKFCWIDRDYLMEITTQDEVVFEIEKYIGT
jgi:hypothetical protein